MNFTESRLFDQLTACGFDFTSTTRSIAVRFPKELDWGVERCEILPFRLSNAFAGLDLVWKIPVNREVENDLPPTRYVQEHHPTADVRANFDSAVEKLAFLLGQGNPGRASNTYERNWRLGLFTIRVISWPRELNRTMTNLFEGKNPYLGISANIYIEPAFPYIRSDDDAQLPMKEVIVPSKGVKLICDSQVYARRNRISARPGEIAVGLVSNAFLVRAHDRTVRIPLDEITGVELTRLMPAEFSGRASVSLNTIFCGRHHVNVVIGKGDESHSLDDISELLSRTLEKPLTIREFPDSRY